MIETMDGRQLIGDTWQQGGGAAYKRQSPAYEGSVWQGKLATQGQADAAVEAASVAFPVWSQRSLDDRVAVCRRYAELLSESKEALAKLISVEVGKPLWETRTEVAGAIGKVQNSIDALHQRRWTTTDQLDGFSAVTRFRPHGVMFVIGPFNLPLHLPGAHMVPALLAGNTIVFKPSEQSPATGQRLVELWHESGAGQGVVNLLHGGGDIAQHVVGDARVAGVLFTGSRRVGELLHKQLAGQPHRVLALELGGNNPLVINDIPDIEKASQAVIMSSFVSSGQRCTCSRRAIVVGKSNYEAMIECLQSNVPRVRVGLPLDEEQPFIGPLVHDQAAEGILAAQAKLERSGAEIIVRSELGDRSNALVSPGLAALPNGISPDDEEHFGPLLTIQMAEDLDQAISIANDTEYGLAAGYIGSEARQFEYFVNRVQAGIVNWNRQTTGASGRLPFGGTGASGNHQPSGYFAADYCSYPVASLQAPELLDLSGAIHGLA